MITDKEYYNNKIFYNTWLLEQAKDKGAKWWKTVDDYQHFLFAYKPFGLVVKKDRTSLDIIKMKYYWDSQDEWLTDYEMFTELCERLKIEI
jgi:hypothetical protein